MTTILFVLLSGKCLSTHGIEAFFSYDEGEFVTVKKCDTFGVCRVVFVDNEFFAQRVLAPQF